MRNPTIDLDETIHQKVRLGILAMLRDRGPSSFNDIKAELELTDGNLSVHLSVLERTGLVALAKAFVGRRPCTTASLTDGGRAAFAAYAAQVGRVLGVTAPEAGQPTTAAA